MKSFREKSFMYSYSRLFMVAIYCMYIVIAGYFLGANLPKFYEKAHNATWKNLFWGAV